MLESFNQLMHSEAVVGAITFSIAGVVGWWMKDALPKVLLFISRYFISSVTFDDRDRVMFETMLRFMNGRRALKDINQFSVRALREREEWDGNFSEDIRQGLPIELAFSPAPGVHVFRLDGRLMWMTRDLELRQQIIERITLSTFGRHKEVLENIIQTAMQERVASEINKIAIYLPNPNPANGGGEWVRARLGNTRRLSTVVLREGQAQSILTDLSDFFVSKQRYEELGIAWRRGYLLFGTPGTGKTSLVTALACEMRLNVCALSLAASGITDDRIVSLLSSLPPRSLLLIEDVDAFFHQREKQSEQVKLSFSGFLNALDGVAAHEGSVVFMTTNHPEHLDPALVRSGRIDYRIELSYCDAYQMRGMFKKFFEDDAMAIEFADKLQRTGKPWSPAMIQERLINAKNAQDALNLFD